jgi:hypothetical protein
MDDATAQALPVTSGHPARPRLALTLAVLSVPGSTIAWDLFDFGGFVIGLPLAIAAIVLGIRARRALGGESGSGMATAAVVIATAIVAMMAVWFTVDAVS